MADSRFRGRHRKPIGMIAEQALHGPQLDLVAERGRGAVRVDVVDTFRRQAGAAERVAHRAEGAAAVLGRGGQMIRIARHSVTEHLGIDPGIATAGMLVLLKYEDAGPLSHHKTITVLVPRPRGTRR